MELIDFTNCEIAPLYLYSGANGKKIGVNYNNNIYMLKFPSIGKTAEQSYSNSVFSEYISCHIFESLGFNTQKTLLGKYNVNDKEKIVCACKDFTSNNCELQEFAKLKNSIIEDSPSNGYGTEIGEIIDTLRKQNLVESNTILDFFWDMFIADSLLGNFDRHNGNWGLLVNKITNDVSIAPIYDCGSCLYPQATNEKIIEYLQTPEEIEKRVYIFPNSAIKEKDVKINYFEYINSLKNKMCNEALLRIYPKINLEKINNIIQDTPVINDLQKEFYATMIQKRYDLILTPAYINLNKRHSQINTNIKEENSEVEDEAEDEDER